MKERPRKKRKEKEEGGEGSSFSPLKSDFVANAWSSKVSVAIFSFIMMPRIPQMHVYTSCDMNRNVLRFIDIIPYMNLNFEDSHENSS